MHNGNYQVRDKADVVVIGGGVIGTSTALSLAQLGAKVCLIEREDIGAGTTSAAAAAALLQTKTSAAKLTLASKSLALLDKLHHELGGCFEFEHTGSLLVATNEAELAVVRDMVAQLQRLGLDVHFVDGEEAHSIMPVLGPGVVGASYSPHDAKINPLELVLAYARAARDLDVLFLTHTEVTAIDRKGDRINAVETTRGKIFTDTVVDATGVWSPNIAHMVGIDIPVSPLKGELLVTEAMPPMMRGTLISAKYLLSKSNLEVSKDGQTPQRSVGITLVQVDHGNFLVGSTREVAGYDRQSSYAGISELCKQLTDLVPLISDMHIIRAYAGLRPITPDGMPIIGRMPDLPGFIVAAGHGGDGLILSAITGRIVADVYSGGADLSEYDPFAVQRFTQ